MLRKKSKAKRIIDAVNNGAISVACGDWEYRNGEHGIDDAGPVIHAVLMELRALQPTEKHVLMEYLYGN